MKGHVMPYIEQEQIATQKPAAPCPLCKTEMEADFVDNGFGPYAVRASPYRCPECGYNEYWNMPEGEAQAIFDSFL